MMEAKSDPRIKEAKKTGPMGVPHLAQIMTHAAPPTAPTTAVAPTTVKTAAAAKHEENKNILIISSDRPFN